MLTARDRSEELDFLFLNVLFLTEYNAKQYSGTPVPLLAPERKEAGILCLST